MSRPKNDLGDEIAMEVPIPATGERPPFGIVVWEDEDDLVHVNEAMRLVFDGTHCPAITAVPDSGSDTAIFVITAQPIEPGFAQATWDDYEAEYLHDLPDDPEANDAE
jgi:hypothetical protein